MTSSKMTAARWPWAAVAAIALAVAGCGSSSGQQESADARVGTIVTERGSTAGPWDGVWVTSPNGDEPQQLRANPATDPELVHPDWSPDGTTIVAARGPGTRPPTSISTTTADGDAASTLARCTAPCTQMIFPSWSPDAKSVVFAWSDERGRTALDVVDVATRARRTVLRAARGVAAEVARWSPGGTDLVVGLTRQARAYEGPITGSALAIVDVENGRSRLLTDWKEFAAYPDWSPDDVIVFSTYDLGGFQSTDKASNLFTIRPDGSDRRAVTHYPPAGTRATQPSWTPDGTSVVFTKVDGGADELRHVAFVRPDGSGLKELPLEGTHPRLQP